VGGKTKNKQSGGSFVTKGKPWTNSEVNRLLELRKEGKTVAEIAIQMNKSQGSIKQKLRRLGLKVVTIKKHGATTTSELIMPVELISVEEALKELVAAMNALKTPGLSRTEVMRLRTLIQTSNLYQKRIAEYIRYIEIEKHLVELQAKYERLAERRR
jgi:IS30 family transposase